VDGTVSPAGHTDIFKFIIVIIIVWLRTWSTDGHADPGGKAVDDLPARGLLRASDGN